MNFLFRFEANTTTGLGHAMRCLGLAQQLLDSGHKCTALTYNTTKTFLTPWLKEKEHNPKLEIVMTDESYQPASQDDETFTKNMVQQYEADWLILDNYDFSEQYHHSIKDNNLKTFTFSDNVGLKLPSNIRLNQNICEDDKNETFDMGTLVLRGSKYFLARRELIELKQKRDLSKPSILITLGGSDAKNLGYIVSKKLLTYIAKTTLVTLACTANKAGFEKAQALEKSHENFTVLWNPDLIDSATKHTMAICAGGVTSLELAALGTASILLILADNQHAGATALGNLGGAKLATSVDDAIEKTLHMSENHEQRAAISNQAMSLVDGNGAKRVVNQIHNYHSSKYM